MSDIKIQPSATGTGVVTLTAPVTNTARTITFPDSTSTLLASDGSAANLTAIPAANITGTLPAISGANLTGISSVGGATGVDFNDDVKARFGTGNDLEIYHDGSNSIISEGGTGGVKIFTAGVNNSGFYKAGGETLATFEPDAGVTLYYDNAAKIATTSAGATVTGEVTTSTGELTNTPTFCAKNGSSIAYTSSTWQTMIFDTEVWDSDSAYSTSTGKFTVPSGKAGIYVFHYDLHTTVQSGDQWTIDIVKNSGTTIAGIRYASFTMSTDTGYLAVSGMDNLAVGDTVYTRMWLPRNGSAGGRFSGFKLIGV